MSSRLVLHVGTPKTGTSFVQEVLFRNRVALADRGVLYPADRFDGQFLAALDLMRLPWGGLEEEARGAWGRLAEQVRRWPGTALVSHEVLAYATRAQADRALRDLGHPGTQVHLVVSARDLARQIPAEWQENVKHRRTLSYARFLDLLRDPARESRTGSWFWAVQELPDILDRWGAELPPERVHVVTVPQPGAPPSLLWERFARTFGLDRIALDLEVGRVNPSLGAAETALLRRVNQAVVRDLPPADYRPLVRELLAHEVLSRRRRSPRLAVPPDVHRWAGELAAGWTAEIRRRGYDVVGDLDELLPGELREYADPDRPRERQVSAAGVEAVRALLLETARLRGIEAHLHERLQATEAGLQRSYLRPSYRLRERAVRRARASAPGRALLRAYRAVARGDRGSSSRSA